MKISFDMNRRSEEKVWNINGEEVVGRMSNRAAGEVSGLEADVKRLTERLAEVLATVDELRPIAEGLRAAATLPSVGALGTYTLSITLKEDLPEADASSSYRAADMSAASNLLEEDEEVEEV